MSPIEENQQRHEVDTVVSAVPKARKRDAAKERARKKEQRRRKKDALRQEDGEGELRDGGSPTLPCLPAHAVGEGVEEEALPSPRCEDKRRWELLTEAEADELATDIDTSFTGLYVSKPPPEGIDGVVGLMAGYPELDLTPWLNQCSVPFQRYLHRRASVLREEGEKTGGDEECERAGDVTLSSSPPPSMRLVHRRGLVIAPISTERPVEDDEVGDEVESEEDESNTILHKIGPWLEVSCSKGIYYFNEDTRESTWYPDNTPFATVDLPKMDGFDSDSSLDVMLREARIKRAQADHAAPIQGKKKNKKRKEKKSRRRAPPHRLPITADDCDELEEALAAAGSTPGPEESRRVSFAAESAALQYCDPSRLI